MGIAEMRQIAAWSHQAIEHRGDPAKLDALRSQVVELCRAFPVP
jgi:glycine/serine hydroxymethyltransferase